MGRTARTVTVSLPPQLARKVDRLAKQEGRTRSELFRAAITSYIERRERWDELTSLARTRVKALGLSEEDMLESIMDERRKRRQWNPTDHRSASS
jgi:metal-responsive CopG/Arc/MetJ family transcriptional regulator